MNWFRLMFLQTEIKAYTFEKALNKIFYSEEEMSKELLEFIKLNICLGIKRV